MRRAIAAVALASCARSVTAPPSPLATPSETAIVSSPASLALVEASAPRDDAASAAAPKCAALAVHLAAAPSRIAGVSAWPIHVDPVGARLLVVAADRVYNPDAALARISEASRGLRPAVDTILGEWPDAAWAVSPYAEGETEYPVMQMHVDRWAGGRWEPSGSITAARAWASARSGFLAIDVDGELHAFGAARAPARVTMNQATPTRIAAAGDAILVGFDGSPSGALVRTCAGCSAAPIGWTECRELDADFTSVEALAANAEYGAAILRPQREGPARHLLVEGSARSSVWHASLVPSDAPTAGALSLAPDGSLWIALEGPTLLRRAARADTWDSLRWPAAIEAARARSSLGEVISLVARSAAEAWVALLFTAPPGATGAASNRAFLVHVGDASTNAPAKLGR